MVEKARGSDEYIAIFVGRERKPPAEHLRRFTDRYGLTWGVTVPADEPGVWPFGALTDESKENAFGIFFALMTAPRPKAYRGGGYPSLGPRQQTAIEEELIYPGSPKAGREAVFVVAPTVRQSGRPAVAHIFRFEVGDSPQSGQSFSPVAISTTALVREQTEKLATDSTQPAWKRIFALNWLAESQFDAASGLLMKYAADQSAPKWLKFAGMLNLGLHQHQPALPLLVAALKESADPLSQAVTIASLGELKEPAAAAEIRPFLSSRNDTIASSAIDAVGKLKDGEAVPMLVEALSDMRQEKRHPEIAKALAKIETKPAWDGLLSAVAGRKHGFQARRWAALSLGEARHLPAIPVLTKVLVDDRDVEGIRSNMISALASLGGPEAWTAISAAANGKNKSLGMSAVQAMGGSKDAAQTAHVIEIAGTPGHARRETALTQIRYRKLAGAGATLKTLIRDAATSSDLRATAAGALFATNEKLEAEDFAALWGAYERERDHRARERLADAMIETKFSDNSRIPALIGGLDEDKNQAWFANVKLLRHLTGQKLGPEYQFSGDKKSRKAELEKWREWWATQAK